MQEERNIADDITAAFSVQGGLDADDADGTDEAQGDEQPRAPLRQDESRFDRIFEPAFQEAAGAEEGEKEGEKGQRAFEELIGDLPI
jgi:hypothetical protein